MEQNWKLWNQKHNNKHPKTQNRCGNYSLWIFVFFLVSGWGLEATRTQTNKDTQISMQFQHSPRIFVVFVAFCFRLSGFSQPKAGLESRTHEKAGIAGGSGALKGDGQSGMGVTIYIYIYIYIYTYIYIYIYICIYIYIYIYNMYMYTYMHMLMYMYMHTHTYIYIY